MRYLDILNALETVKSSRELCELMRLKDVHSFVKTWLEPLTELGYIVDTGNNVYRRTIYPQSNFFAEEQPTNTEEECDE